MPMLGGPQTDYLNSVITLNLGKISINNLTITNNDAMIAALTTENDALATANARFASNNVTITGIIAEIPDNPSGIAYLTQVSVENDAAITANDVLISRNSALISTLTDQNVALAAENDVYTADNVILAAVIAEVTPN